MFDDNDDGGSRGVESTGELEELSIRLVKWLRLTRPDDDRDASKVADAATLAEVAPPKRRRRGGSGGIRVFSGAEKARLAGMVLSYFEFDGVDFSDANLDGARFEQVSLRNCDFTGASLRGTKFIRCDLRGAAFANAHLMSCRFDDSWLVGAVGLNALQRKRVAESGGKFLHAVAPKP